MYKHVDLLYETQDILERSDRSLSEMSQFDLAFLSGMIKEKRPQRIVEVGIAAGGTTVVILNTIKMLGLQTELISLDLSEQYYRNPELKTGFLLDKYREHVDNQKHSLLLGKTLAERIEDICESGKKEIDFLILDTVHSLPGEILDFLCILPYLSCDSCVVLHDIRDHHLRIGAATSLFATQVLFDTVSADKYFMWDKNSYVQYPNIAAFEINSQTEKNILDVFNALSVKWEYIPDREMIEKYLYIYKKNYNHFYTELFESILQLQIATYNMNVISKHLCKRGIHDFLNELKQFEGDVYIYGTGYWGETYYTFAQINDISIKAFVISDGEVRQEKLKYNVPVLYLSELHNSKNGFIIAVNEALRGEIESNISNFANDSFILNSK